MSLSKSRILLDDSSDDEDNMFVVSEREDLKGMEQAASGHNEGDEESVLSSGVESEDDSEKSVASTLVDEDEIVGDEEEGVIEDESGDEEEGDKNAVRVSRKELNVSFSPNTFSPSTKLKASSADSGSWTCRKCTYLNPSPSRKCGMCLTHSGVVTSVAKRSSSSSSRSSLLALPGRRRR